MWFASFVAAWSLKPSCWHSIEKPSAAWQSWDKDITTSEWCSQRNPNHPGPQPLPSPTELHQWLTLWVINGVLLVVHGLLGLALQAVLHKHASMKVELDHMFSFMHSCYRYFKNTSSASCGFQAPVPAIPVSWPSLESPKVAYLAKCIKVNWNLCFCQQLAS